MTRIQFMADRSTLVTIVLFFAVLLGTAAVYWPGLDGPFLLDDYLNIVDSYVNDFDRNDILYALTHNDSGELGRPVSVLSLVFSGIVHGPTPWGYKYHNLAIHLINGLLIFWLMIRLLPRLAPRLEQNTVLLTAGTVTAVWLLHPLMVSTVLYAVQRMAQLSTLFTLVALLLYSCLREQVASASNLKFILLGFVAFPLAMVLAMLSKENGALIVFYILMIEWLVYRFSFAGGADKKRVLVFLAIFSVIPILIGSIYTLTHFDQISDYSQRTFTLGERLLTQLHVVLLYLKMILLPRLSDMTLFHDYIQVTSGFDAGTVILMLLFLGTLYLVWHLREKAPVVAFGIAWFVVSHLMESTIFSLELMFEHRNYLAAVGPLLIPIYYCFSAREYPQLRIVCGIFLFLVVFMSMGRVAEWRSRDLIYEIAIAEHPDSYRAQTSLANIRFNAGQFEQALEHLRVAQQLNEKDFGAILHEVIFKCGRGLDKEPLLTEANRRAGEYPVSVYSLNALDNVLVGINNGLCPELDIDDLLGLVQTAKNQEDNRNNDHYFGFLQKVEGQSYMVKGEYGKGIPLMLSAYENTGMVRILARLAENLIELNLLGDAEVIIQDIERISAESFGNEAALLEPLKARLQAARESAVEMAETNSEQDK